MFRVSEEFTRHKKEWSAERSTTIADTFSLVPPSRQQKVLDLVKADVEGGVRLAQDVGVRADEKLGLLASEMYQNDRTETTQHKTSMSNYRDAEAKVLCS